MIVEPYIAVNKIWPNQEDPSEETEVNDQSSDQRRRCTQSFESSVSRWLNRQKSDDTTNAKLVVSELDLQLFISVLEKITSTFKLNYLNFQCLVFIPQASILVF